MGRRSGFAASVKLNVLWVVGAQHARSEAKLPEQNL